MCVDGEAGKNTKRVKERNSNLILIENIGSYNPVADVSAFTGGGVRFILKYKHCHRNEGVRIEKDFSQIQYCVF